MLDIIESIKNANPERSVASIKRRLLKMSEEKGEVCEAILNLTCEKNSKNKTWDDLREELVDCFIVAVDIALTFDVNFIFTNHIRHLDVYDENNFIKKMLVTDHLLSSLIFEIDEEEKVCSSKSIAILFFELATLVFPDKENPTPEEIFENFSLEIERKINKWKTGISKIVC
jgi:NTP pyrophosphatase (non-canonical NTP hydrolase)